MADDITHSDTININWDLDNYPMESYSITTGAQGSNYVFDSNTITTSTGGYTSPTTTWGDNTLSISDKTLLVNGNSEFNGDVKIKGRSLTDFMNSLEQRLNILQINPALEKEWDQLRELGEQYRDLERQLTEKSQMWETLKR
jgi:hypothetical protein